MKQLFSISIVLTILIACNKKVSPSPATIKDSIVGIWSGRYGTNRNNPTAGSIWCAEIKANDSIIVYDLDSLPNSSSMYIARGKWSITEKNLLASWQYANGDKYSSRASVSNQNKSMDGNFFLTNNSTRKDSFFFNKLPK